MPSSRILGPAHLALVEEHGWPIENIARTWNLPVEEVEETLSNLSMEPLPEIRKVPRLPATPVEAQERRAQMQQLYRQGWSIDQLTRTFFYYSEVFLTELCQRAKPKWKACACGCGEQLTGKQQYATPACRQRGSRKRKKAPHKPATGAA
jgi:hypothetical protein